MQAKAAEAWTEVRGNDGRDARFKGYPVRMKKERRRTRGRTRRTVTCHQRSMARNPQSSRMTAAHVFPWTDEEIAKRVRKAVALYWNSRSGQATKQKSSGKITDYGTRSEVTGGQHLNAFVDLLCDLIRKAGFSDAELRFKSGVEIPGFYRPTKKWDVVVVRKDRLCAAMS